MYRDLSFKVPSLLPEITTEIAVHVNWFRQYPKVHSHFIQCSIKGTIQWPKSFLLRNRNIGVYNILWCRCAQSWENSDIEINLNYDGEQFNGWTSINEFEWDVFVASLPYYFNLWHVFGFVGHSCSITWFAFIVQNSVQNRKYHSIATQCANQWSLPYPFNLKWQMVGIAEF